MSDACAQNLITGLYSAKCWTPVTEQCGNYKQEGDCYNREHTWPKSYWNGSSSLASYTDLFHLYPCDGYDNGMRSNYWLGFADRASAKYVTSNGSFLSKCLPAPNCDVPGCADNLPEFCWEPTDEAKGRLARVYFYMSTRYMHVWTCCDSDGANGATIKPWLLATLLQWHESFPVTYAESARNDIVFQDYQGNRNPFVDYPAWVSKIWS